MHLIAKFVLFIALVFPMTSFAAPIEYGWDRPGYDFENFDQATPNPRICQAACRGQARCRAWTYVRPGVQGPSPRCWLKWAVPRAVRSNCCVSGTRFW